MDQIISQTKVIYVRIKILSDVTEMKSFVLK